MRLTAKERILLHLLEFTRTTDELEAPPEVNQEGVARGAGIDLRHLAQMIRPLIQEGLVLERKAHVKGIRQRRKVYMLTEPGRLAAIRLQKRVSQETVRVRGTDGVTETSLAHALRRTRMGLVEAVLQVQEAGIIGMGIPRPASESGYIEAVTDAPRIAKFVGRRKELAILAQEDTPARVFVIRGVAGIGKSALAARACELAHGRKNLFWHRVRPWEREETILASLGRFLESLGRPGLGSVLRRGETDRAGEVLRQDLPGTNAMLVFDDAHEAPRGALSVFRMLTEAAAHAPDVKVLILTRRALPFYEIREVAIEGILVELELRGLEADEAAALLADHGDSADLAGLGRRLGGHPLAIELVRRHLPNTPRGIRDLERFMEETFYRDLTEAERTTMKGASLYQVPVPRTALLAIPGCSYETLLGLQDRCLLRRVGGERYEIHDTIREYSTSILTESERASLGGIASGQLQALAAKAEDDGDYGSCVGFLSNALRLSPFGGESIALLEGLGDAFQSHGDLPQALSAYKDGMARATDPETLARFHGKVARALFVRGLTTVASKEVEAGLRVLRDAQSIERGWLELWRGEIAWADRRDPHVGSSSFAAALEVFKAFRDALGEAYALISLGYTRIHERGSDAVEGERLLMNGLSLAESLSNRGLVSQAHSALAHFYISHVPDATRAAAHAAAMESSDSASDYYTHESALWWKATVQTELLADFAGAEETLNVLRGLARRTYAAETDYFARHMLAAIAYYRGDIARARRESEDLWQESRNSGWFGFPYAIHCLWRAAECCLWQGDREGFERLVAELDRPGVKARLVDGLVIPDVMRGLREAIRGDSDLLESLARRFNGHGKDAKAWTVPGESMSFLVPYYHGIVLAASGMDDEAALERSRAIDLVRAYRMKARLEALQRKDDRLVRVFHKWVAPQKGRPTAFAAAE